MATPINTLNLPKRHLRDPIDAFQMDREVREIKESLSLMPIMTGEADPEGNVPAILGSLYLRTSGDFGRLYQKASDDRLATGWSEITGNFVFNSTGAITLPSGTTAQRPSPAVAGMFRFNTTTNQVEYFDGTIWV